jgi:hypothetical protein
MGKGLVEITLDKRLPGAYQDRALAFMVGRFYYFRIQASKKNKGTQKLYYTMQAQNHCWMGGYYNPLRSVVSMTLNGERLLVTRNQYEEIKRIREWWATRS